MAAPRIMLVEDDESIAGALAAVLAERAFDVLHEATGRGALASAGASTPALVLLDLGLPDTDGIDVCRRLRAISPAMPILILTARDSEVDVVLGLNAGASDYITKPFRLGELFARIDAHLRHATVTREVDPATTGGVVVDREARRATRHGVELALRNKEFELLAFLVANAGRALPRERILAEVWDDRWGGASKTLDMHVSMLRRRLGPPDPIATLRGVGYRFDP